MRYVIDLMILAVTAFLAYLVNGYLSAAVMVIAVAGLLAGIRARRRRHVDAQPNRQQSPPSR